MSKFETKDLGGGLILSYEAPEGPLPALEPETLDDIRKRALNELREARTPMLNAVTGIMATALTDNDEALAEEGKVIRQKLLDVTLDHALNAATNYTDMKLAGQLAYRVIARSASVGFAAVFREITGA